MVKIFVTHPTQSFFETLLHGIEHRYALNGMWGEVIILVPNRRSIKLCLDAIKKNPRAFKEVPKIVALLDIDQNIFPKLLPWIISHQSKLLNRTEQQLYLSQLIMDKLHYSWSNSFKLANEINHILNNYSLDSISFEDIANINVNNSFINTQKILTIITKDWPLFLKTIDRYDYKTFTELKFDQILKLTFNSPVIIADTISSNLNIFNFITQLVNRGAELILPNIALPIHSSDINNIIENFLKKFNYTQIEYWNSPEINNAITEKNFLNHTQAVFEDYDHEAATISLKLLNQFKNNQTALVVCENNQLIEKIKTYMAIWGAKIDSSIGESVFANKYIKLFKQIADWINGEKNTINLLEILKSKLVKYDPQSLKNLEHHLRYNQIIIVNDDLINDYQLSFLAISAPNNLIETWELNKQIFTQLTEIKIEEITEIAAIFSELDNSLKLITKYSPQEYLSLVKNLLTGFKLYNPYTNFTGIKILSFNESLFHQANLVIIADFNENSLFPSAIDWLPNYLQQKLGLDLPQFENDKIIYILQSLILNNSNILITRSANNNGNFINPSFLLKLLFKESLKYCDLHAEYYQSFLNLPLKSLDKPKPQPAMSLRPKKIWVTELQKLMRNPYEFYALKILNLKPLELLNNQILAKNFGIFIHNLLEKIVVNKQKFNSQQLLRSYIIQELYKAMPYNLAVMWQQRMDNLTNFIWELLIATSNKIYTELPGIASFSGIELGARIDHLSLGNEVVLIDYKTGVLPQKNNIVKGFESQLILAVMILLNNGFKNIKANDRQIKIKYLKLIGGNDLYQEVEIEGEVLNKLLINAEQGVIKIFEQFIHGEAAFINIPKSFFNSQNLYDHLARTQEWLSNI